ncbi:MAG: hypothetical protein FWG72_10765 [Oscillospiraceae bacterium]|nr:hypothetical protein [Oscillospiraceae bacterium]
MDYKGELGDAFLKMALEIGKLPEKTRDRMRETALPEAGRIMEEYQIGTIQMEGLVDTAQLRETVGYKVLENRVNVYSRGMRKERKERNTGVAFMLDRKGGVAQDWMQRANLAAGDDVFEMTAEKLGQFLDENF